MLAPPKPHCAFGPACSSQPEGQEKGPDICSWCKNLSFAALYEQAGHQPDTRSLNRLVDSYLHELDRHSRERLRKGWSYLCACKDPEYRDTSWRKEFNPQDARPCGTVRYKGQLCTRCYSKAQEQQCPWLTREFDGDRFGFPCVFEDSRLCRPVDLGWRIGPVDERGDPDPNWEKDPRTHRHCERVAKKNTLCQRCYERICEIKGFGRYFEDEWGTLRPGLGL